MIHQKSNIFTDIKKWLFEETRKKYSIIAGYFLSIALTFYFFIMMIMLVNDWINSGPEAIEKSIVNGITEVNPECQSMASMDITYNIINKGKALEKDDVNEILEKYKSIDSQDCKLMMRQIKAAKN